ncbi:probable UDP-N-acetylglucosamine pyrophosphorylase [Schistocerca gregaria]|uniref:probable UDP-N-acetylglucosamine pyrophosphorylase n=1 Tax=Schistocerca gregaria TaxID=7010 RepID=UPI00211DF487|nr:probable UDP-N-acetylglucosamine pyrophosphorylase [Schistocerca gregaria]XP_049851261.1 probable UDP-N-acetylglucosamine pyrophosphorylase [Schistocerca gregaria]
MTSSATECSTKQFFELHNYFGLDKKNIFFFNQGYFPCCFEDGRVMMQSKYQIACAPNGNGGLWEALEPSGVLQDMERRKIRVVSSYCVDNVLAKVADPIFAGFLEDKQCDVSCKVIEKKPEERVGVFCLLNNSPAVIEYSEIDQFDMKPGLLKDVSNTKQSINSLFNIAHIVLNNFSFDFVQRMSKIHQRCPSQFHLAKKCIPHIDSNGKLVADKMGLKFERFVFDVFPLANKLCALKVRRNEEFSPLKNSVEYSFDNSITCRLHLSQLCKEYIKRAGGRFETEDPNALCEISPRVTYSGEGLEQLVSGKTIELPCYIH